jgi:hypothetical protein
MTHEFNYGLSKLTVEGEYYKGTNGDYFNPPEPSEFEIHKVYVNGVKELVDVTELLENDMRDIEIEILNKFY